MFLQKWDASVQTLVTEVRATNQRIDDTNQRIEEEVKRWDERFFQMNRDFGQTSQTIIVTA
jgi:MerR family transcriptional regulator, repressor of the yfmOP operon